ncbi:hypothetical protein G3576_09015 [Roseomonas stagni]|uniref:DUF4105 domain-containing protein n=1 Tax=Falsiroseomonas algicola TaxID=2716930 RepID=A0A6M1LJ34_9PROT|nr:hypothetical protein [Falsiroseomonas algicola]NGM20152.1 hypothetical protein [Falsiroseomonas algicola]
MTLGASITLPFPRQGRIALVVRYKPSRNVPPPGEGHADVIMPSGAPVGFFVDVATERRGTLGFDVPGQVYGYAAFASYRPAYVNLADATAGNVVSGVLLIQATAREQDLFQRAWQAMRARPGTFTIAGWNCSSHAALAFHLAGLVGREIPGLDTPDNLFHELRRRHARRCEDHYGYLGFLPRESSGDELDLHCDVGIDAVRAPVTGPVPPRRPTSVGDGARPGA